MTNLKHAGTGHTFIEIELPNGHGTFKIEDDGDNDEYVTWMVVDGNGDTTSWSRLRREVDDDEKFTELLEAAFGGGGGTSSAPGGGVPSSFNAPPVFKCDDCNRSWPRSKNQTPDQSDDTCPECDNK